MFPPGENPLLSDLPQVWDDLIAAVNPASLLVMIERRLSHSLRNYHSAEDLLQDALLHAWRDRRNCQWRGIKSFRSWLLSIIDNRIHDAADREAAQKRGGGAGHISLELALDHDQGGGPPMPMASTTPSRIAVFREQAAAMSSALHSLPIELCEVVRLRLFDQLTLEEIATHLNIGVAAVRHRFRKGAAMYHQRLEALLASRSPDFAPPTAADSSASI